MSEQRMAGAEAAAWLGIFGNLALAAVKGTVGVWAGSKALVADAAHSGSDAAASFAALVGLKTVGRPTDKERSFYYRNVETITAILVSVLLLLIGAEVAISSLKTIYAGVIKAPDSSALVVIAVSLLVKEAVFQYKYRLGRKLGRQPGIARGWEHRSDVCSSLAALAGAGGAIGGQVFGVPWLLYLDPVAGVLIAFLVLRMGYRLIIESIPGTLDRVLQRDQAEALAEAAARVKGVIAVDELRAREHGHDVIIELNICVNPRITVMEGHEIAKAVKQQLMNHFTNVSDVFIQVNPYDAGYPYKSVPIPEEGHYPTLLH